MGVPVIKNSNVRGLRPVKKETEKELRLRLAAADMKPLREYWSKGKTNNKTKSVQQKLIIYFVPAIKPELVEKINVMDNTDDVHPRLFDVSKSFDKMGLVSSLGVAEVSVMESHLRLCRTPQPEPAARPVPKFFSPQMEKSGR